MLSLLLTAAFAVVPPESGEFPRLIRVEDPDFPGAVARSATASLLTEPPPAGTPWSWEPDVRADGWPSYLTFDAVNAEEWHDAGFRGQGVKAAIFDLHYFGATLDDDVLGPVDTWDCYAHASCELAFDAEKPQYGFEEGDHGFACAEIVHELAPEAELNLVRVNGLTTLQSAADWAIRHDIDVISMSLSFFNASMYDGTGPFADVVKRLVANDVLLVTSAGNSARQHWEGDWRDGDGDGRMDFDGDNGLLLDVNGSVSVYVNWNEYGRCGDSDLAAKLYDAEGFIVGKSDAPQSREKDQCSPVERVSGSSDLGEPLRLEVRANRLVTAGLHVHVFAQSGAILGSMPQGSIVDPGNHAGAFTVGAVRADGYLTNGVESFSSQGSAFNTALKPDIAGPDGLDATVYGAEGFFGTSAATPAVAGTVALLMSSQDGMTSREAADRLSAWALRDGETRLHDDAVGAGKVRLPTLEHGVAGCGRGPLVALLPLLSLGRRRRRDSRAWPVLPSR